MKQQIVQEIFKNTFFTEKELDELAKKLQKITIKKNQFLLKSGEKVDSIYYIYSGCLRTYYIDFYGKEHTLQFAIKNWWISDYIALFGKEKTNAISYIECVKEAVVFKISKTDFDALCNKIPKISNFHIKNLESAFASFQKRILENLTLTAKERYKNFVNTYPNIEQNVKNYHIASFLGITTESLSRIRKEITKE